ncbi:glycosyltransferase family 4 protein [Thermosulfurimonas dismutans]|uniref:Glycosyltransferase n=1 Tax=Thermosulfurimonas dismutans TaxID=999894 RepID=A0A179D6W1_9BACT|nr:glycosyltransferase family 4 protein [Thermosulfurimonas dismutans]OAQ21830.1 Glycosyltransferase [Thermosulfurimonas dismutans]
MKIALVRPKVGFSLGGAENYTATVAQELASLGHEVVVVADYCNVSGVRHAKARIYGRGSIAKTLSFFLSARKVLAQEKFDIVYTTWRFFPADWVRLSDPLHAVWINLGYEGGAVALRKLRPRHRLILWLEQRSLVAARRIIANSKLVQRQVAEHYPEVASRVEVIYNGVDFERYNLEVRKFREEWRAKLGLGPKEIALLFAGSDWRRKGLPVVLSALEKLPETVKLVVAGGKKLGPKGRVHYLGMVREMEKLYGAADILVLPTRYDPFANVVLEALACGLPVVTTPENGASELIKDGINGSIVIYDPQLWAKEIQKLLKNLPSLEDCRESVKDFSWENHLQKLL